MTIELTFLAATLVLALVHIVAAALAKRRQEPPLWAAGARDTGAPRYTGVCARLIRAQDNLMETLPLYAAAVLVAHAAGRDGALTVWGAALYCGARTLYLPLYAFGTPYVRTLVWIIGTVGLCLVLAACLLPGEASRPGSAAQTRPIRLTAGCGKSTSASPGWHSRFESAKGSSDNRGSA